MDAALPRDTTPAYGTGAIRPDFIPADRYKEDEVAALERQRLWPRVWQIVCREEEIPHVGDYVAYEICDESIVVVRSSPSEIKAFYNVCQHRGRRLIDKPSGNISNFYCRFHGWKYDLDGRNTYVYHRDAWKDCPDFTDDHLSLKQPRCERWAGWVWINMDPRAESSRSYLGYAAEVMDPFAMADLRRAWHTIIIAPVNWKVILEAFHEGYHSGATHTARLDYKPQRTPTYAHGRHAVFFFMNPLEALPSAKREDGTWKQTESFAEMNYYLSKELYETLDALVMAPMMKASERLLRDHRDLPMEQAFPLLWNMHKEELEKTGAAWPPSLTMEAAAKAGTSWHLFPNTIVLPGADGVLWYRMRPHGKDPDQSIFDVWCLRRYAPGQEPVVEPRVFHGFEAAAAERDGFLSQDYANMSAVNAGMKSRGWHGARTNPQEEVTTVNFHRVLDQYLME